MSTAADEALDSEVVDEQEEERELAGTAGLMALNRSEIDQMIVTSKKYPRSVKKFINTALQMVTLSEEIAGECIYCLPRGKKPIEGPSARFAEIIASAWGNCRAGARTIGEDDRFVTAQGFFLDTENNVAITYETKRRITKANGETFGDDMIGVTSNAACSIALRNAVLKGVPKAFWNQIYLAAKKTSIGDAETLIARRTKMMQAFAKMFVQPEQIYLLLEIQGEADITLDHLATLRGIYTAVKDGDTTVDQAFGGSNPQERKAVKSALKDKLDAVAKGKQGNGTAPAVADETSQVPPEPADERPADEERFDDNGGQPQGRFDDATHPVEPKQEDVPAAPAESEPAVTETPAEPQPELGPLYHSFAASLDHKELTRDRNAAIKMEVISAFQDRRISTDEAIALHKKIDANTDRLKPKKKS